MGCTKTSKYANGRLDNVAQGKHLPRLTDARLEYTHLCLLIQQPHGEGDTNLRIVAAGRAHYLLRGQKQLIKPFLDHRLTIGASDADNGDIKLITMALCESLKGRQRVGNTQEIGIWIKSLYMVWHLFDHEMPHTTTIKVADITMPIVSLSLQSKEKRLFRETKAAAVSQQPTNLSITITITARTNQRRHLFYRIFHLITSIFQSSIINLSKCKGRVFFP